MRYNHDYSRGRFYRRKRVELSPESQELLRRWLARRDAMLRERFPDYFRGVS